MRTTGLFTGSFDPIHAGHVQVIEKALETTDRVFVAVCGNPVKQSKYSLSLEEAGALAARNLIHLEPSRVHVFTSTHSASTICLDFGCDFIIRGYRNDQEKEREETEFTTLSDLNLLPKWTRLKLIEGETKISSTSIKGMIREFLIPQEVSMETAALMMYKLNNAVNVNLVDEQNLVAPLFHKKYGTLFDPQVCLNKLIESPTPGFLRAKRQWKEDSDYNVLLAYYGREFRKRCKNWEYGRGIRLIQTNFVKSFGNANIIAPISLVVNNPDKATELERQAKEYVFGKVFHLSILGSKEERQDRFNSMVQAIRTTTTEEMNYERNWRVPDHKAALGRELR